MDLVDILLFLHFFGVIAGIGPTFVFGRIAGAGAGTEHGMFATRVVRMLTRGTAIPLSALVLVSGFALIFEIGFDLTDTPWLLISVILFLGAFTYSVTVQNPTLGRVIALSDAGETASPTFAADIARLRKRVRYGGVYLRTSAIVILALMVFKPF